MPRCRFLILLTLLAATGASRLAAAQSCDDIASRPWSELRGHIYLVHGMNDDYTPDVLFRADGTFGGHLAVGDSEVDPSGRVKMPFRPRPTLHFAWNHLVQSPGTAGNWENASIVVIEPIANYDQDLWAATPYDTITLGPHTPGPGTTILVKASLIDQVRNRITRNSNITLVSFTGSARAAVAQRFAAMPTAWRVHSSKPDPRAPATSAAPRGGLDVSDLGTWTRTVVSAPIWVTSAECPTGVQILGDARGATADRVDHEPAFMTELWRRNLHFGLHRTTLVEQIDGSQSPGGQAAGLYTRLDTCTKSTSRAVDITTTVPDGTKYVAVESDLLPFLDPQTLVEQDGVYYMEQPAYQSNTVPCSRWIGAGASAFPAADRLTCRAIATADDITSRTKSSYAGILAKTMVIHAMYADARVTDPKAGPRSQLGYLLWIRVWLRYEHLVEAARTACNGGATDWASYIGELAKITDAPYRT